MPRVTVINGQKVTARGRAIKRKIEKKRNERKRQRAREIKEENTYGGFSNLQTWLLKQFVVFCWHGFEIAKEHRSSGNTANFKIKLKCTKLKTVFLESHSFFSIALKKLPTIDFGLISNKTYCGYLFAKKL